MTIALQLWHYCPKDLQTFHQSNGIGNRSKEQEMLAKIKVVTVTTQNVLVNVNIFLCMRQRKVKIIQLYLGRLKGAARHCDFTLPMGQTSNMHMMVLHSLVLELQDAAIAKDVMEEYATNNYLQDSLSLEK